MAAAKSTNGAKAAAAKTRWTEEQVKLLMDTVQSSSTAKEAFQAVAAKLGKSAGTVQQKYYNLQKQAGGAATGRRRGRPRGSASTSAAATRRSTGGGTSDADLRQLSVDDLVGLAVRVRAEVDRRRQELDAASKLLAR